MATSVLPTFQYFKQNNFNETMFIFAFAILFETFAIAYRSIFLFMFEVRTALQTVNSEHCVNAHHTICFSIITFCKNCTKKNKMEENVEMPFFLAFFPLFLLLLFTWCENRLNARHSMFQTISHLNSRLLCLFWFLVVITSRACKWNERSVFFFFFFCSVRIVHTHIFIVHFVGKYV